MAETDNTERTAQHSLPGDDPEVTTTGGDEGSAGSADDAPAKSEIGKGEGGADTSSAGNILAGVQPTHAKDDNAERRHD